MPIVLLALAGLFGFAAYKALSPATSTPAKTAGSPSPLAPIPAPGHVLPNVKAPVTFDLASLAPISQAPLTTIPGVSQTISTVHGSKWTGVYPQIPLNGTGLFASPLPGWGSAPDTLNTGIAVGSTSAAAGLKAFNANFNTISLRLWCLAAFGTPTAIADPDDVASLQAAYRAYFVAYLKYATSSAAIIAKERSQTTFSSMLANTVTFVGKVVGAVVAIVAGAVGTIAGGAGIAAIAGGVLALAEGINSYAGQVQTYDKDQQTATLSAAALSPPTPPPFSTNAMWGYITGGLWADYFAFITHCYAINTGAFGAGASGGGVLWDNCFTAAVNGQNILSQSVKITVGNT